MIFKGVYGWSKQLPKYTQKSKTIGCVPVEAYY